MVTSLAVCLAGAVQAHYLETARNMFLTAIVCRPADNSTAFRIMNTTLPQRNNLGRETVLGEKGARSPGTTVRPPASSSPAWDVGPVVVGGGPVSQTSNP